MGPTAWRQFLGRWNRELLGDAEVRRGLPAEVVASGWLGYPGATPAEIERAESRLGVRLPPSYRTFLTVSNGWHPAAPYLGRLWSTEEIGWYAGRHSRAIVEYLAGATCEPTDAYRPVLTARRSFLSRRLPLVGARESAMRTVATMP